MAAVIQLEAADGVTFPERSLAVSAGDGVVTLTREGCAALAAHRPGVMTRGGLGRSHT
jgi:hypothetical protein